MKNVQRGKSGIQRGCEHVSRGAKRGEKGVPNNEKFAPLWKIPEYASDFWPSLFGKRWKRKCCFFCQNTHLQLIHACFKACLMFVEKIEKGKKFLYDDKSRNKYSPFYKKKSLMDSPCYRLLGPNRVIYIVKNACSFLFRMIKTL